ncbi:MAG: hypothetical protein II773_00190, partial [Oscillospiraceae bacterium]|nr:hypothetical protein [Oscillospiraceae bacterium]
MIQNGTAIARKAHSMPFFRICRKAGDIMPSLMRTDKFVSEQLGISRTDAKKLISSGSIAVNGSCVTRPEH